MNARQILQTEEYLAKLSNHGAQTETTEKQQKNSKALSKRSRPCARYGEVTQNSPCNGVPLRITGGMGGVVVKPLASHRYGPGSIPGLGNM